MNRSAIFAVCGLFALAVTCQSASSQTRDLLEDALSEYRTALEIDDRNQRVEGFRRAHLLFQKAAESVERPTPELLTNLGNSAAQSGQAGHAIAAYHRALQETPDYRRARANLAVVRRELPDWVRYEAPTDLLDSFFFWTEFYGSRSIAMFGAILFLLAAGLVAASIRWQQPLLRNLAVLPAITWLLLVVSLVSAWRGNHPEAVVIADEVIGRSADSAAAAAKFASPIPAGTEVSIIESRDEWTQVEFANAQTAWMPSSSLDRWNH